MSETAAAADTSPRGPATGGGPAPVPVHVPGRMFLKCNLVALAVAAVALAPAFVLPSSPRDPAPALVVARYDVAAVSSPLGVSDDEIIETPLGPRRCTRVSVECGPGKRLDLWVAREAPNLLVRWRTWDNQQGTLRALGRD